MLRELALFSILCTLVFSLHTRQEEQHSIYVDGGSKGINNSSCGDVDHPCKTLYLGLKVAHTYTNNVTINIAAGVHYKLNDSNMGTFENMTRLSISGSGMTNTTVSCTENVGFKFVNIKGLTLEQFTVTGCGALQSSTSKNSSSDTYLHFRVALYVLHCEDLNFSSLAVVHSPSSIGTALYNTIGANTFTSSHFSCNMVNKTRSTYPGGGGLKIEFSDLDPRGLPVLPKSISNSTYEFTDCEFNSNKAFSNGTGPANEFGYVAHTNSFGQGAGVSLVFGGHAQHNAFSFLDCHIESNTAEWAGGMLIAFQDSSKNNTVLIKRSSFFNNQCKSPIKTNLAKECGGGGVRVVFIYYPPVEVMHNNVTFSNCKFIQNMADFGGGVSIASSRESPEGPPTNFMLFEGCRFLGNNAVTAAALDLSLWYPDTIYGHPVVPVIKNCTFEDNAACTANSLAGHSQTNSKYGIGTVYVNQISAVFQENTTFCNNKGTALVITNSIVNISSQTTMAFKHNIGQQGGGIAIIGAASLVLHEDVDILFEHNVAYEQGGAIYAVHFGEHDSVYEPDCFIRYHNLSTLPKYWKVNVTFNGNFASGGRPSALYASSLSTCVWPDDDGDSPDFFGAFCWDGWTYVNSNCTNEISTAGSWFTDPAWPHLQTISAVPGQRTALGLKVLDDRGNDVTSQTVYIASLCPFTNSSSGAHLHPHSPYISDNNITVYGEPKHSVCVQLQTLEPRIISTKVNITLAKCPPGYVPKKNSENMTTCSCADRPFNGLVKCSTTNSLTSSIGPGVCVTYVEDEGVVVAGKCPYSPSDLKVELPANYSQIQSKVCKPLNRVGLLCGKCMDDDNSTYGVEVLSHFLRCVPCTHPSLHWLEYLAIQFLPITAFFLVVVIFNISATSAPMNAYIFFCQIIVLARVFNNSNPYIYGNTLLPKTQVLEKIFATLYGIWNLDFLEFLDSGFCLNPTMTSLQVMSLSYVMSLYPLVLIAICYVCIELHGRNFRVVVWLWKPFQYCLTRLRRHWEPKTSIIDVFATFLLIAYTKLLFVSVRFLTPIAVYKVNGEQYKSLVWYFDGTVTYFHGEHIGYALLAIFILLTFILVPTLFLALYPLKAFQMCLGYRCCHWFASTAHTFADTFQGCYKDGTKNTMDCRYFTSLYFLLRIITAVFVACQPDLMVFYMVQIILFMCAALAFALVQPYKRYFFSVLDSCFFALMASINAMSAYNYYYVETTEKPSAPVVYINYVLLYIPLVYITCCALYFLIFWRCIHRVKEYLNQKPQSDHYVMIHTTDSDTMDTSDVYTYTYSYRAGGHPTDDEIPDRLVNPQNYSESNRSSSASNKRLSVQQKGSSRGERTRLSPNSHSSGPYGSIQQSSRVSERGSGEQEEQEIGDMASYSG